MTRPTIRSILLAGAAAATLLGTTPADAAFTFTVVQSGADVVATGSGSVNVSALTFQYDTSNPGVIIPLSAELVRNGVMDLYSGLAGPSAVGAGTAVFQSTATGDLIGLNGLFGELYVPVGYVSGTPLSTSITFAGTTLGALGVTPGTYVWTWGQGASADSMTIDILAAVPAPAALPLFGLGLAGLAALRRGRRA